MKPILFAPIMVLLAAAPDPAEATVRRVPLDHATITAALAAAGPGDTVEVAAGTYAPSTNGETFPLLLATDNVALIGAGMGVTVLDAEGTGGVIRHTAPTGGRISGFRITGGSAAVGGGVRVDAGEVQVDHDLIDGNGASVGGGGIYVQNDAAPWIHHNLILDNFATTTVDVHGLRYDHTSSGVFEHNLVARTDGNGLLTTTKARPTVRHNIFYANGIPDPERGRGICWLSDTSAVIHHNLFFANQKAALLWSEGGGDFSGVQANDFDANDEVYGNLDGDPLFVNEAAGDWQLQPESPAVDAGDPSLPHDPDGTVADLGPFPFTHVDSVPPGTGGNVALSIAPNPLSDDADVRFTLARRAKVRVEVLDLSGRRVRVLVAGAHDVGSHVVRWNGTDDAGRAVGSGVYYVRLRAGLLVRAVPAIVVR